MTLIPSDETSGRTGYILVVEDSHVQAKLITMLLEEKGYTIKLASDGREAYAIVENDHPALIVSDILMPYIDGFELTRQIRNNPVLTRIPVLLLTQLNEPVDMIHALSCGADSFITKPFDYDFLLTKIEKLLTRANQKKVCPDTSCPIHIVYNGQDFLIESSREKILEFLLMTYEMAIKNNHTLQQTNEDLLTTNEELQATKEELRVQIKVTNEALAEKEVLLSEVHHRVKNNLTAFISLLSLDGSYEDTEGGQAFRKDLQNRARSMALIHETLYRTGKFSNVDMEIYLPTLVNHIAGSYKGSSKILTSVDAQGVVLDLARATTAGLIINELVTNSFKYAFPAGFNDVEAHRDPCMIQVSIAGEEGTYILTVSDNGCGLPPEFDPLTTKSLGLKLVKFLARHQLRAEIEIRGDKGTEFIFRLNNKEDYT
ncbi:MAG: response regulator [Methanobacteriota archaeon]